ncbi:MAG: hypothetical protein A2583_11210 [Bdellovibrionales bacterium RIFOXYD1_FULL_53_11]|nr:MAG: hypothetical protein A2583_11210 [Bdellovibrionales bacterium RIFOXYD1_FULL_53_11]
MSKPNLEAFKNSLESLEKALVPPPANDRERDGAIQRFEYTIETAWKTGQKILKDIGIASSSPKSVVRDLAQQGFIDAPEEWLEFIECRNETAHIYNEKTAARVFLRIAPFFAAARKLLSKFENHVARP